MVSKIWVYLASSLVMFFSLAVFASATDYPEVTAQAEVFADIGGSTHGLAIDNEGNMYVGISGFKIVKITPGGKIIPFAELEGIGTSELQRTDMLAFEVGPDNMLYSAARDRILKITRDGKITTLIKEDFPGPYGAVDLEFDDKGNLYVSYGNKIAMYTPSLEKSFLIDGDKETGIKIENIIGIKFDADCKNLYAYESYYGRLIKISLNPDGTKDKITIEFEDTDNSYEYLALFNDNIVINGPDFNYFYLINKKGIKKVILKTNEEKNLRIDTVIFRKGENDKYILYGPSIRYGKVYKINLEPLMNK